jgi:hypothetical protein
MASTPPPGGNGTISVIGRVGQVCAQAPPVMAPNAAVPDAAIISFIKARFE